MADPADQLAESEQAMTAVSMEPGVERWRVDTSEKPPGRWRLLRNLALVIMLAALVLGASFLARNGLPLGRLLPLHSVALEGDLNHVSEAHLRSVIGPLLHGGLLGVNVTAIRRAVEALPWVDHATVYRVWPDALRIKLKEQVAVARWGGHALLNKRSEVFRPDVLPEGLQQGLPHLVGPEGSETQVLRRFHRLRRQLGVVGLGVVGLALDARRSWTAELDNGALIRIGRTNVDARIQRFLAAWPRISADHHRPLAAADLRYPNGFAIRWAEPKDPGQPQGLHR